jgi:parvulin-like peptidyl-prolyl isomerase
MLYINEDSIGTEELRSEMARLRRQLEAERGPLEMEERLHLRTEALDILIERTLLIQEARRLQLTPSEDEVRQTMASLVPRFDGVAGCRAGMDTPESRLDIARRMTIDRVVGHWRSAVRHVKVAESREFYRKNRTQFHTPEMVNAAHIVRNLQPDRGAEQAQAEVEELRSRVVAGEAFGEVAKRESDCPESGGELGWCARGVMVEEFDDVVFRAAPGTLTPVFRTRFGFHFALVRERRAAGIPAFGEVRTEIERRLALTREDEEVGRKIAVLRAHANIRGQI